LSASTTIASGDPGWPPKSTGTDNKVKRLVGWKMIGQYLACTARTARRWEEDRAMPVHRVPGGGRASVWALPDELTAWLNSLPPDAHADIRAEANPGSATAAIAVDAGDGEASEAAAFALPRRRAPQIVGATAAILAVLAIGALAMWQSSTRIAHSAANPSPLDYEDIPAANALYKNARFELSTRSAESLATAEKDFRQLTEHYPDRAAGWSGLADTYLLVREFGAVPDAKAYPEALRAARAAIALDQTRADAWLDMAFIAFWWESNSAAAFREFETAVKLDPTSAKAFHWYATALAGAGKFPESLVMIARARALDPGSRAIAADESWLLFCANRRAEGLAALESLVQVDPKFAGWHNYLARAYLVMSRDEDFLREAQTAAELRGQANVIAGVHLAEAKYRAGGRAAMLDQLTANEEDAWRRGAGSADVIAGYRALANDRTGTLKWLTVAKPLKNDHWTMVQSGPEFANLRADPQFMALQAHWTP
jgi:tetratricopeptide (TPR) repeat protein